MRFDNFLLPQVEPCDDFYNFMCGGYSERTILPAEGQASYFYQDGLEVRNKIRRLLENGEKLNSTGTDGAVTRFFRSCLDTAEMERLQGGLTEFYPGN